ncbi:unnamed protein product, partial [marine sediment metagenome]
TMAYKEKIQNKIKKDELRNLWENIFESYEQGGVEQIKLTLNELISSVKQDYKELIEKLEKIL